MSMAGKEEWERLWLVNKPLSVWKATVNTLECLLKHGTLSWAGVRYVHLEVADVSKYQYGNSRTVVVCVFYRLGWVRAVLRAGGREVLGCSGCSRRCWGVRMQRVSLHLPGLTSSSRWAQVYGVSHHASSRLQHFGVCTFTLGWGEPGLFWQQPHEEHLDGVVSWICCSPAVLASEGCFAAEYAAVRKSKGKFLFKAIWKNLRDIKSRRLQVSNPSVETIVWLRLLYLQSDLTSRNFVLGV